MLNQFAALIGRSIRRVYTKGPIDSVKWGWWHLSWRYREWSLGIETADPVEWDKLSDDPECVDYEPVSYDCLDIAMRYIGGRPHDEVLLDYGSGKGRAVISAARYPFRRVIGVEHSATLSTIARENLKNACAKLRCPQVEFVTADARQYEIPADVSVIFMFNPFRGRVMSAVQEQIRRSLAAAPRRLKILYVFPNTVEDEFADCSWLTPACELPVGMLQGSLTFRVYENLP